MKGWRSTTVLGLFSSALLASEPAGGPEAELSLELLEFLGEYANEQGELNLPDDFDSALTEPADPAALVPAPGQTELGKKNQATPARTDADGKSPRQAGADVKTTAVENKQ